MASDGKETNGQLADHPTAFQMPTAFGVVVLVLQVIMTVIFSQANFDMDPSTTSDQVYNYLIGVALMMFVGFGYLMTFLKAYGLGAVGFTMFITCLGVQFSVLFECLVGKEKMDIDFMVLMNGNFAVATVLISFGGLIGKVSPLQMTICCIVEIVVYTLNKVYVLQQYEDEILIEDVGGTIVIHVFGAYFGLFAAKVMGPPRDGGALNASSYNSDLFSLIGTVFLWLYWPSFVSGPIPKGPGQTKALVNTILSLLASTVATFGLTPILMKGKIGTVPIQNATLAGGVAIGATANLVDPFGAVVIGTIAGLISTYGFVHAPVFGEVDTCGIHNLHGMPGVFGALASIVLPVVKEVHGVEAWKQAVGLAATLAIASLTGAATGFILKQKIFMESETFNDVTFWDCAEPPVEKAAEATKTTTDEDGQQSL